MLVSTKGRYALRLMVRIANDSGEGKVALHEVADREDISLKYLEQLVRPLVQAGLLNSVRGKGGGYVLAKEPADIRAGDILRAVEGTTAPVACAALEGDATCPREAECTTVKFWAGLDQVIEEYVDSVTLADLMDQDIPTFTLDEVPETLDAAFGKEPGGEAATEACPSRAAAVEGEA